MIILIVGKDIKYLEYSCYGDGSVNWFDYFKNSFKLFSKNV